MKKHSKFKNILLSFFTKISMMEKYFHNSIPLTGTFSYLRERNNEEFYIVI